MVSSVYILITPVKNEEKYLPKLAESVIGQTLLPALWVIVDDGSTDHTSDLLKKLGNQYDWVKIIRLPLHPRDITFHYSYVCKRGFDFALELCKNKAINYDFIGLVDADTILERMYFEKLILEFKKRNRLGIASGHITDMPNGEANWDNIDNNECDRPLPRGSGRLWRKECFFETGGYQIEPSPDSISNIKANLRGWEIRLFGNIKAIQLRDTSGAQGLWKGYRINGSMAYYLNKRPLFILLGALTYSVKKPYYSGVAYIYGYLLEWLKRTPRISDPEIRNYYRTKHLKEYFN